MMYKVLVQANKVIKEKQQEQGWTIQLEEQKWFTFGSLCFQHTLVHDGNIHYPFVK
ncbi:hypothetical protein [Virgibacillus dokdonensis]|uniref:hypothetical protein n=1 Tax=Virgibacillus dokdonensis TaxID=302167 RepID=UPI002F91D64E